VEATGGSVTVPDRKDRSGAVFAIGHSKVSRKEQLSNAEHSIYEAAS
jgi:hypothetical protein